ncbi:MAG: DMT family transporter [Cyanothece sp. SIO1E1]|nr:DMT family transporter [Cyanothece sp. SIO1E1]
MSDQKPSQWKIGIFLAAGILSVSSAAILIRLSLAAANTQGVGFSLVLSASRLALAAILLLPSWQQFSLSQLQSSAFYYSGAAGLFLALHFTAWTTSLSYTSIAASTTLVTTGPIWVALLSWLWLKEKPKISTLCGISVALVGGILIAAGEASVSDEFSHPLLGDLLALIGAGTVSFYFLLGRQAQQSGISLSHHIAIAYTTAALVLLPLPFIFGASYTGYPGEVYLYMLLLALFPQLIGHTSFNWAVRWISPTLVALTILLEPIGSSCLGYLLFDEIPSRIVILGAAVILLGVAIATLGNKTWST